MRLLLQRVLPRELTWTLIHLKLVQTEECEMSNRVVVRGFVGALACVLSATGVAQSVVENLS